MSFFYQIKNARPITGTKRIASRYHLVCAFAPCSIPLSRGATAAFLAPRLMGFEP